MQQNGADERLLILFQLNQKPLVVKEKVEHPQTNLKSERLWNGIVFPSVP